jgi:hypothetical protein
MRLPRVRLTWRSLLTPLVIVADLLALWVWAARPPRVYSDWLGLVGLPFDAPIFRLFAWAREENAPRTPSGCVSLFQTDELFIGGVLLLALGLLIVPLVASSCRSRLGLRLALPVRLPRFVSFRFRVTTALMAIAIFGLYLGWEIDAWRTWRLRDSYLQKASVAARDENANRSSLQSRQKELAKLEADSLQPADLALPEFGYYRSKAALAAQRAIFGGRLKREISHLSAMVDAFAARRHMYERAAAHPREAVAADSPLPVRTPEPYYGLGGGNYARVLADCDEVARTYPDFVEAHGAGAWIRASCPDARYRDGKLAVASATRACELTNWKDTEELSLLAAAFAEAGDFAEAVKWQEKAVELTIDQRNVGFARDRLALFKSGKPYRHN